MTRSATQEFCAGVSVVQHPTREDVFTSDQIRPMLQPCFLKSSKDACRPTQRSKSNTQKNKTIRLTGDMLGCVCTLASTLTRAYQQTGLMKLKCWLIRSGMRNQSDHDHAFKYRSKESECRDCFMALLCGPEFSACSSQSFQMLDHVVCLGTPCW